MWRQREHRGPDPGGENGAREQPPPPGRALQIASSVHLHTRCCVLSDAPSRPRGYQTATAAPALPERPRCPSQPRVSARPPFYPSPSPPPLPAAPPRLLRAPRGRDGPRPAEFRLPPLLLLRQLSSRAANSRGHRLRTRCPPCAVTAASAALPGCAPAPLAASRTFLCAKTSSIRSALRPSGSARTCADDSSLLVIPNPEKIHSVCTSKRVSLLKSKLYILPFHVPCSSWFTYSCSRVPYNRSVMAA